MKWFKHISDSLDDPKIFELLRRHKADGYLVFFGILEIYAREFKTDDGWMLHTSTHYLKQKLQGYHTNRLAIILQSIQDLFSWTVNLEGDNLEIYVPKFRKYLDESTLKKLRAAEKNSGSVPERVPENVRTEEEEEVEVEEERDTPPSPPGGNGVVPYGKILEAYHKTLPTLHPCKLNQELKTTLKTRWNSEKDMQTLEWWKWYFDGVSGCDFLMGKKKDFMATFPWLIGPKNMTKVLGGQYINRNKTNRTIEDWINGPN